MAEGVKAAWLEVERVIAERQGPGGTYQYLCKWRELPYSESLNNQTLKPHPAAVMGAGDDGGCCCGGWRELPYSQSDLLAWLDAAAALLVAGGSAARMQSRRRRGSRPG